MIYIYIIDPSASSSPFRKCSNESRIEPSEWMNLKLQWTLMSAKAWAATQREVKAESCQCPLVHLTFSLDGH